MNAPQPTSTPTNVKALLVAFIPDAPTIEESCVCMPHNFGKDFIGLQRAKKRWLDSAAAHFMQHFF